MQAPRQIEWGLLSGIQSGSPPGASPDETTFIGQDTTGSKNAKSFQPISR
jgi:hypothetical protein